MTARPLLVLSVAALALAAGCLDPLVDDRPAPGGLVLPPGTVIPDGHADPALEHQIADHDGVDGEVPLLAGFAGGTPIAYWSFGAAPDFAAPLFVLVRRDGDGVAPVDHAPIAAVVPGDPGYSPYWVVWQVAVTDRYGGEVIASTEALEEAEELGLVDPPTRQPVTVNCPVVAGDVTLEVGADSPTVEPTGRLYRDGRVIRYYDFGPMAMADGALVAEAAVYRLRREGGEPLSEPARGVDMTGDGDTKDSNDIFAGRPDDPGYTPHRRLIEVVVPAAYQSIDSSGDQTVADFRDAGDLFDPDPVIGNVVAYQVTDERHNLPQQRAPGGL